MGKNGNFGFWYTVPATANMQIGITGKLKAGLALFVGGMLTDDSWCALGDEHPTKSVGKKHLSTTFFQTTELPKNMQVKLPFISSRDHTVLIKALNSNKPPIRGLMNTTKNSTINH